MGSAAWKGRAPVLGDLLRLYLCHSLGSGDSVGGVSAAVLDLASNILPKVSALEGGGGDRPKRVPSMLPHGKLAQAARLALVTCQRAASLLVLCRGDLPGPRLPYHAQVPDSMRAEDSAKSVGNFASLSGHTVTVWYRVCWEQLLVRRGGAEADGQARRQARLAGLGSPSRQMRVGQARQTPVGQEDALARCAF